MNTRVFPICFLMGAMTLSACASLEAPVPSSTESAVGVEEAGFYPLSTRIGIADIDVILAAVESEDFQQVHDLLHFITVACTTADGLGGPPKCQENEADGAVIEVFPFLGTEGSFLRKAEMSNFPGLNVAGLYAIYKMAKSAYSTDAYPAGEYAIMFVGVQNQTMVVLQISDGGIVRMDYHDAVSDSSFAEILKRDAMDFVLEP